MDRIDIDTDPALGASNELVGDVSSAPTRCRAYPAPGMLRIPGAGSEVVVLLVPIAIEVEQVVEVADRVQAVAGWRRCAVSVITGFDRG